MSVHVLQNPIKVIKIEGNLNDSNSWRKLFSKLNGDIFNGFWLMGLKSFSYYIETTSVRKILNIDCNVVKGFEHDQNSAFEKHCNPPISQIILSTDKQGFQLKTFEAPTFFLMNNVCDSLEIKLSFFQEPQFTLSPPSKNIPFEAVFHYYCQSF
jgi:hypothetical protein